MGDPVPSRRIGGRTKAKPDPEKLIKQQFLDQFEKSGTVKSAREQTGINWRMLWRWRRSDPEFIKSFNEVDARVTDDLEDTLLIRAKHGYKIPVMNLQGEVTGSQFVPPDHDLLKFLLKARKPEKYREQIKFEFVIMREYVMKVVEVIQQHVQDPQVIERIAYALKEIPQNMEAPIERKAG